MHHSVIKSFDTCDFGQSSTPIQLGLSIPWRVTDTHMIHDGHITNARRLGVADLFIVKDLTRSEGFCISRNLRIKEKNANGQAWFLELNFWS